MAAAKEILFVGGQPRSGTSALARILNAHPRILIGLERYYHVIRRNGLTPDHFVKDAFLAVRERQSSRGGGLPFASVEKTALRFDEAAIVGDKYPPISGAYPLIDRVFPGSAIVYILRNPLSVMQSHDTRLRGAGRDWKRGAEEVLSDWNESVCATLARVRSGARMIVVAYERLFAGISGVRRLFARIGVSPDEADERRVAHLLDEYQSLKLKPVARDDEMRLLASLRASFAEYRELLNNHCILGEPERAAAGHRVPGPAVS